MHHHSLKHGSKLPVVVIHVNHQLEEFHGLLRQVPKGIRTRRAETAFDGHRNIGFRHFPQGQGLFAPLQGGRHLAAVGHHHPGIHRVQDLLSSYAVADGGTQPARFDGHRDVEGDPKESLRAIMAWFIFK